MNQSIDEHHILLVEDDKMLSRYTLKYLEKQSIDVVHAPDGERALALLETQGFRVIVTDLNMPKTDGLAFVTELRQRGSKTPVIVTTGVADKKVHEQLYALGVDKIYVKPLLPDTYLELIEHIKRYQ